MSLFDGRAPKASSNSRAACAFQARQRPPVARRGKRRRPRRQAPAAKPGVKPGGEHLDRKSVVEGKSVSVRVDLGGRRIIKKTKSYHNNKTTKRRYKATRKHYQR